MGILALHIKTSATGFVTTRKWKPFSTAYFQTCKYHGISNEEFPCPNVVVFCVTCIFISSIGKKYYNCTFFFLLWSNNHHKILTCLLAWFNFFLFRLPVIRLILNVQHFWLYLIENIFICSCQINICCVSFFHLKDNKERELELYRFIPSQRRVNFQA